MLEAKRLMDEILKQRPDLDEAALIKLIEEKKRKVGAGYLSDAGACWLISAELDVSLERAPSFDMALKDLYIGADEITVVGRVLSIYPLRKYAKRDGAEGLYRRLVLFDEGSFVRATLWDERADLVDQLGLGPESPLRVVKAYVRAGLDGRPVLNLGTRGGLELVTDPPVVARLPTLEKITKEVQEIGAPSPYLCVKGVIRSPPRASEFFRSDGKPGKLVQFHIGSLDGSKSLRVAVWDNDSRALHDLPLDSVVRVVNVKARLLPHGDLELHGDEGTSAKILSVQGVTAAQRPPQLILERALRILSIGQPQEREVGILSSAALAVDASRSFYTLIAKGEAYDKLRALKTDSLVTCASEGGTSSTIVCEGSSSLSLRPEGDGPYPLSTDFYCKVGDLKEGAGPAFLEVIALSRSSAQDVVTRGGSTVRRAELMVGDGTGEVGVVAWGELAGAMEGVVPGDRLRLKGMAVRMGRGGAPILQLRSYSSVDVERAQQG